MKKFFALIVFLSASLLFADLYRPHRLYEFGVDADVSGSNNFFKMSEMMVKDLVFDFQEMNATMPDKGWILDFHTKEKFFFNLNFSSHCRVSLFWGVESSGYTNLEKDFFSILAEGIQIGQTKNINVNFYADIFADMGFSYQTIIRNYGVKIAPSYYVPILYVPNTKTRGVLRTRSSGLIDFSLDSPVDVYTVVDMEKFMEDGKEAGNLDLDPMKILGSGGFDVAFEVERNVAPGLNVSVFGQLPIVPATMKHKMSTNINAYFYENNALGVLSEVEDHDFDYEVGDFIYSQAAYKVWRPFKLGMQASYRPLGQWLTLKPKFNFALRDPYRSERVFYPEYDLSAEVWLARILGLNLGTGYENRVYGHYLGFMVNLRLVEINARVAIAGSDFKNSFGLSGARAYVGARIGF